MSELLFLAVEEAIPADHPAALLAVPLGLLFFGGSVFLLLWSNYGAKKAAAMYGVAFFGFSFLIGVFWWFGGPGIPTGLGINHLPGQTQNHYQDNWFAFEADSPRSEFFTGWQQLDQFEPVEDYTGLAGAEQSVIRADPRFAALSGSTGQAVEAMQSQFLPIDENNVPQIGVGRLESFEADAAAQQPAGAVGRAQPFYTVERVGDPRLVDDPDTGVLLATQRFQAQAVFVDGDNIPLEPVPVGEAVDWFAFYDPGAEYIPAMLWTLISLFGFLVTLFWLDRLEMREKRLLADRVEEPENLKVPIAQ